MTTMAGSQALHTDPPHRFGDVLVRVSGVERCSDAFLAEAISYRISGERLQTAA